MPVSMRMTWLWRRLGRWTRANSVCLKEASENSKGLDEFWPGMSTLWCQWSIWCHRLTIPVDHQESEDIWRLVMKYGGELSLRGLCSSVISRKNLGIEFQDEEELKPLFEIMEPLDIDLLTQTSLGIQKPHSRRDDTSLQHIGGIEET